MATTSTKGYGAGSNTGTENLKGAANQAADTAKDASQTVGAKAKEVASSVGHLASTAASAAGSAVGQGAEHLATSAGSGVRHLGETIKDKGPQSGMFGSATRAVADTLTEGGKYLEEEGFSGMIDDVTNLVRRNPIPAIFLGIGLGFLIGRTLRS